jgi:hypothetical protein
VRSLAKRLRRLEVGHAAQRNEEGLTPADAIRLRRRQYLAKESGRPMRNCSTKV